MPGRGSAPSPGFRGGKLWRRLGAARWVLILVVVAVGAWYLRPVFFPPEPAIRTAMLVEEIRTAAKLSTVELQATVVANRDESAWYGAKFLFMAIPGRAAVGFDLEQLNAGAIRVDGAKVSVTLPPPQVLYVEVDLEHVEVYSAVGLLRPQFTPEETRALLAQGQQKIREKASQEAVLKRAREQATELVRKLTVAAGAAEVEVTIR
jgi:hypothetical protein